MALYFDDLEIGTVQRFGRYEVTRAEVLDFASRYDPQPFHLSDDAAAQSLFGRLAASGWHTAAMTMRMIVENWQATGLDKASMGGIGMDELRWIKPVYPGDMLSVETELLEKTPSRSKPDRGIIRVRWTTLNQHDEPVMTQTSIGMMRRRP
ncbi:MAG: MaoC family dehydratase [Sphingobium sp.]